MLPFRSGRSWRRGASAALFALALIGSAARAASPTPPPPPTGAKVKEAIAPGGVPLPIGHEAKGIVLPDYDPDGRLKARFEAAIAKRIDADRIEFRGLKMTTFTPEQTPDMTIDMPLSTLVLSTRVVTSQARTTVTSAEFSIAGDKVSFNTVARHGKLVGNVKMMITGKPTLPSKPGE